MSAGPRIARLVIPIALFSPQVIKTSKLCLAPVVLTLHNLAGDILCAVGGAGNLNLAGNRCVGWALARINRVATRDQRPTTLRRGFAKSSRILRPSCSHLLFPANPHHPKKWGYKGRGNGFRVAREGGMGKSEHAWRGNSQKDDWLWIGKSAGQNGGSPICTFCNCDL
jgi:hypothetical protein